MPVLPALCYRLGQALVIASLSALIAACAAFAPLYDRAMQQAAVDVTLRNASTLERDLQLYGSNTAYAGSRLEPAALATLIPGDLYGPVVEGRNALTKLGATGPEGELWWRAGQCDHVEISAGACPDAARQILITDNDAETYGLAIGDTVTGPAADLPVAADGSAGATPMVTFTVVGTYRPADAEWWQGLQLGGLAGVASSDSPRHDTWLTDASTFGGSTPFLDWERAWVGTRLRTEAIGVEELARLGKDVQALQKRAEVEAGLDSVAAELWVTTLTTELPALADRVDMQIEQSRTTVPLLLVQLGLLGAIVLWLMLRAATDQRRSEVVLARLRGLGTQGARSLLMRELLPPVLLGIVPGVALAFAASSLVRAYVLPESPPFELPRGLVLAVVIAAATLTLVTYAAAARTAREPLDDLLHRTSGRRPGWRLGAGDAVMIAATGAGVFAFVTDSLTGPLSLAAPALLSILVGLVLAHLFAPAAVRVGRAQLARGRLLSGVPLLEAARDAATRHTVTLVTVASALAVFSMCAVTLGDRNRELAAEQEVGAVMVAELYSAEPMATQFERVQKTLTMIDPDARRVTPVLRMVAPSGASMALAVDPDAFRRIALFTPGKEPSSRAWSALSEGGGREPIATIVTGALGEEKNPTIIGLDGIEQEGERVAAVDRIPGGIRDLALVDLDTARKLATPDSDSSISLWFAEEDPALLDEIADELATHEVLVGETRTLGDARASLDESVATWSLWLGALVGVAAVIIALLGLSVLSITGWRTRARDLAALAMAGVGRRTIARLPGGAQLVPVVVGVLAGAGCGLLGVVLTMPEVPLFAIPPQVDSTDLSIPWTAAVTTTAICLLVLGAAAALLGRAAASSARLDRIRETA